MDSKYYCLTDTGRSFLVMHDFFIPSEEFPIHTQSDWELVYILRGRGTFIIGNLSQPFAENEGFLIPPDMLHGWIFDRSPGNEVEDICFQKRVVQGALDYLSRDGNARLSGKQTAGGV